MDKRNASEHLMDDRVRRLKAGEAIVVGDEAYDALCERSMRDDDLRYLASVPNPNRVGILDAWLAYLALRSPVSR